MSRKTRKLMWSVPLIAAVAVIGTLAAFMTLGTWQSVCQRVGRQPAEPGGGTAASGNAGRTTLVLSWPSSGQRRSDDMYRIDVSSSDNDKFKRLTEVSGTTLTHSHEGAPSKAWTVKGTAGWDAVLPGVTP